MQSYINVRLDGHGYRYSGNYGLHSGHHHHTLGSSWERRRGVLPTTSHVDSGEKSYGRMGAFLHYLRKFVAFLFSQIGIAAILVLYTVLGAMLFSRIECCKDKETIAGVKQLRSQTVSQLWSVTQNYNVLHRNEWNEEVDQIVIKFQKAIVLQVRRGYSGEKVEEQWTFPRAIMYSLSIYTTIGYGNLTPQSDWGKVVTCLYAVIGIPLLLLYMANIGDLFANTFVEYYDSLERCKQRIEGASEFPSQSQHTRNLGLDLIACSPSSTATSTSVPNDREDNGKLREEEERKEKVWKMKMRKVGKKEEEEPNEVTTLDTNDSNSSGNNNNKKSNSRENGNGKSKTTRTKTKAKIIPISTCFSLFLLYILVGTVAFSVWEGWDYSDGAYFCFVSLVTIGFGDLVPGSSSAKKFYYHYNKQEEEEEFHAGGGGSVAAEEGESEKEERVDGQLILCSIYILFGMGLMSTLFHLTQERFFITARKLGKTLHLI